MTSCVQFLSKAWACLARFGQGKAARIVFLLVLSALLSLAISTIPRGPVPTNNEADRSLNAVLHYAHDHRLQFGTQIISTFGPLGYLVFPYYFPQSIQARFLTDVALCFVVALGLCQLGRKLNAWAGITLLALFAAAAANIEPRTDLVIESGLFAWTTLCWTERGRRLWLSVMVLVCFAAFVSLAKTSFLVLSLATLSCLSAGLVLRKIPFGWVLLPGFFGLILAFWLMAGQRLVNLPQFVFAAGSVIQGYSDTVGMQGLNVLDEHGILILVLSLAAIVSAFLLRSAPLSLTPRRGAGWLFCIWLTGFLFAVWKHSFLRADLWHMGFYFAFVPALALVIELLASGGTRRWLPRCLYSAAVAVSLWTLQQFFSPSFQQALVRPLVAVRTAFSAVVGPGEYQTMLDAEFHRQREAAQLPEISKIIGNARIDVFSQHQFYAVANRWNYTPRPVFQSYSACNRRLMQSNEEFFWSTNAPAFVLFGLYPEDRRLPALEDAWLLRHLLLNFEVITREGPFLLLRSRGCTPARPCTMQEGCARIGERLTLPREAGVLWLEVEAKPSFTGRIRALFLRPPKLRFAAWDASNKLLTKRPAPVSMMSAGFLASPLVSSTLDCADYLSGERKQRPAAYSVEAAPGQARYWRPELRFRVARLDGESLKAAVPTEASRQILPGS